MPDVIELLNHDHREVEERFARFKQTQDRAVVEEICDELTVHTQVEEEIVYPVLKKLDGDLEKEAEEEHDEARKLIERIRGLGAGDPQLPGLVHQLEESVQHHVQEEESEAWPKIRQEAGDQLDELGAKVEERKEQIRSGGGAPVVPEDATKDELYEAAKEADISGRSSMNKDELKEALEQERP